MISVAAYAPLLCAKRISKERLRRKAAEAQTMKNFWDSCKENISQRAASQPAYTTARSSFDLRWRLMREEKYVFFDIDDTILVADTPFVYGLPGSDAFVRTLDDCVKGELQSLKQMMEESYYAAPQKLVDPRLPALITDLRRSGSLVLGLTSRSMSGASYSWHNEVVVDALRQFGIRFSPLPLSGTGIGKQTTAGGVLFADGEKKDKAVLISQIVPSDEPAALVDNTVRKLRLARSNPSVHLNVVHFTAASTKEQTDEQRWTWICGKLQLLRRSCKVCEGK